MRDREREPIRTSQDTDVDDAPVFIWEPPVRFLTPSPSLPTEPARAELRD